jgi:hypothetical protein
MVSDAVLRKIPPRSWRRLGYAFLVLGLLVTPIVLSVAFDAATRRSWPMAGGIVTAVEPSSVKDVHIAYTYRAGGRELEGREQRRKNPDLKPGAALFVRYDPADPRRSTTRPSNAEFWSAGVGLFGAAVVWGFAVWGLRFGRERRAAPEPSASG